MKKLKLRLNVLLDNKHITRYELAKKIGVGYPTLDRYYKNTITHYNAETLLQICLALNCGIGDLLEITDE